MVGDADRRRAGDRCYPPARRQAGDALQRDTRLLRPPLLGDLIAKVEVARFSRTLATLLGNGVTLLGGLSIVKETMTNIVLAARSKA